MYEWACPFNHTVAPGHGRHVNRYTEVAKWQCLVHDRCTNRYVHAAMRWPWNTVGMKADVPRPPVGGTGTQLEYKQMSPILSLSGTGHKRVQVTTQWVSDTADL